MAKVFDLSNCPTNFQLFLLMFLPLRLTFLLLVFLPSVCFAPLNCFGVFVLHLVGSFSSTVVRRPF